LILTEILFFTALLFGPELSQKHSKHIGCIDPHCNPVSVVMDAYENARFLCDQYYLASPDIIVKEHNSMIYQLFH
jgi:pyruvate dehydrogenase kinase 2/3/4